MIQYLDTDTGRRIAYHFSAGDRPVVIFLGGYKSDMAGTKAVHLEGWAQARGQAFLRFDYSGHGESSGAFEDGTIGTWAADALAVIDALTDGPLVLVGSSMGGWIALLVALLRPDRVSGLVGIAAAPDFTEDSVWAGFDDAQRETLLREGRIALPSDYGAPYVITRALIEDGRDNLVLRAPVSVSGRVRLLQGTEDADVTRDTALRLLDHLGGDVRLTLVKGADHRFSDAACLSLIEEAIVDVLDGVA